MRIDSSGNVGIGTTSPQAITGYTVLTLNNATQGGAIEFKNNNTSYGRLLQGSSAVILETKQSIPLIFNTDDTERMRIDSSGNVGIGTTSPAAKLHVANTSSAEIEFILDPGSGSSEVAYINSYRTNSPLGFKAGDVERMRIDSAGRLLVGTTTGTSKLSIAGTANNANSEIQITATNVASGYIGANSNGLNLGTDTAGIVFKTGVTGGGSVGASGTERMRINNSGISFIYSDTDPLIIGSALSAGTSNRLINGIYNRTSTTGGGTTSFKVYTNGNVENTNDAYGQISDVKLKENIVDAPSQWDDFKAVRFRKYNFKEESGYETFTQLGVIAQELELTSPGLVYETADQDAEGNDLGTTTKAVKSSVLTKKALVALQEAMARIEQLEAKVTALEAS
jgi:hypothetical protein